MTNPPDDAQQAEQLNGLMAQLERQVQEDAEVHAGLLQELQELTQRLEALEHRAENDSSRTLPRLRWPEPPPIKPAWVGGLLLGLGLAVVLSQGLRRLLEARVTNPSRAVEAQLEALVTTPSPAVEAQLTLQAVGPSWLEVRDMQGSGVYAGELLGRRQFSLAGGLQVLAGRPDLVRVQVGAEPVRVLGRVDQVKWQTFPAPGAEAPNP